MLCQAAAADNLSLVGSESLTGKGLVVSPWPSVVDIRMDGYSSSRSEQAQHLDVLRIHQFDQVIEDDVDTILVETSVVTETEQVEFEALALNHTYVGNIADADLCEIRLSRDRAQSSEFRAVETHPVITAGMHVLESLEDIGSIIHLISGRVA